MEPLSFGAAGWGDELAEGAALTLALAVGALLVGVPLGLLGAAMRLSRFAIIANVAAAYVAVMRGVPELLIVLLVYYGGGFAWQAVLGWFGYVGYAEIDAFAAGVTALGVVFGAFATEVFRGAFLAVPAGQIEAARALGMHRFAVFRLVLLPQAWRLALPGLGNLWLVLLKDTALVSVIALNELTRMTTIAVGATKQPFTFYFAACAIYLALTLASTVAIEAAARHAGRGLERLR
jgi:His/Glu/Gln/Arg/opine family amino acid ABC transporter permease subunit